MRSFPCLVVAAALLAIFAREALAEGDAAMMPEEASNEEQPQPLLSEGSDVDASVERVRRQVAGIAIGLGGLGGGRRGGGRSDRRDGPFRNGPPYRGGPYGGPFYGGGFPGGPFPGGPFPGGPFPGSPFGNPYYGRRYAGRFGGDFYGR